MGGRRGGRGLDPIRALEISLDGNARRHVDLGIPTLEAVTDLRTIAGTRTDLLAKTAGSMIGGYLGHPLSSPLSPAAAYLLVLAADGNEHATLVEAGDHTRLAVGNADYTLRTQTHL